METRRGYRFRTSVATSGRSSRVPNISRTCTHQVKEGIFKMSMYMCVYVPVWENQWDNGLRPWRRAPTRGRPQRPYRRWLLIGSLCHPPSVWTPWHLLHTPAGQTVELDDSQERSTAVQGSAPPAQHIPFHISLTHGHPEGRSDWLLQAK